MIICERKVEKSVPLQNDGHFTDFFFRMIAQYYENCKTTFPMTNFNEIWLKVADH